MNILTDDQVFNSYLTNTFMLNQLNALKRDLRNGKITNDEMSEKIKEMLLSVESMPPDSIGFPMDITNEEFYEVINVVKKETIENLIERRKN